MNGVEIDNAEAVGNATTRSRTTSRADPNLLFAGVAYEVPDHEEIVRETHVRNDAKFILDSGLHFATQ
jgi:hypothetical protein